MGDRRRSRRFVVLHRPCPTCMSQGEVGPARAVDRRAGSCWKRGSKGGCSATGMAAAGSSGGSVRPDGTNPGTRYPPPGPLPRSHQIKHGLRRGPMTPKESYMSVRGVVWVGRCALALALGGSSVVAHATEVRVSEVETAKLSATLYVPADGNKHPALLVLGGAE